MRSLIRWVFPLALSFGALVGCATSVEEEPSLEGSAAGGAVESEAETRAFRVIVKEDCSSLSKGGSCGSYGGYEYCNWCPADGCDQSKCECLRNSAGTGCNGPSSGPAR